MRLFRVFLLTLLMVMLPLRGVMAAAMLCPPTAAAVALDVQHVGGPLHRSHGTHDAHGADHAAAVHGAAAAAHHHDDASGTDTCNLCSACCSMPPLVGAAPTLSLPHALGPTSFPVLSVPPPDFLSDGPERPPRST